MILTIGTKVIATKPGYSPRFGIIVQCNDYGSYEVRYLGSNISSWFRTEELKNAHDEFRAFSAEMNTRTAW